MHAFTSAFACYCVRIFFLAFTVILSQSLGLINLCLFDSLRRSNWPQAYLLFLLLHALWVRVHRFFLVSSSSAMGIEEGVIRGKKAFKTIKSQRGCIWRRGQAARLFLECSNRRILIRESQELFNPHVFSHQTPFKIKYFRTRLIPKLPFILIKISLVVSRL